MTRVLVSGGNGLLGATLVPVLRNQGYEVFVASRAAENGGVDLRSRSKTVEVLDRVCPDVVINLVAATDVDQCERDPVAAYRSNALVVGNLAAWIQGRRDCRLIQISTDQLYDSQTGPSNEDCIAPANYYAYSKYAGELLALGAAGLVLRTNLFGRSRHESRSSISDWLVSVMRNGQQAQIFTDIMFSPLSLETLCATIARILPLHTCGIFNLGSTNGMSKADFALELARVLALPTGKLVRTTSDAFGFCARRPKDMRMDVSRFESTFAISLPSLESEIDSMRAAYAP
jgi:dTDP-4-dehydrorhamnose reductase